MPLILVIEQEQRYVERIEEALSPQGWEVVGVDGRAEAMRLVADRAADLVVVNAEVGEATELVDAFARVNGGPGAVVLVPESGNGTAQDGADEVLKKPFTDQDIRLAVRRCLSAAREAPVEAPVEAPPQTVERLSSEDLFGDVVLELEGAFSLGAAAGAPAEASEVEEPQVEAAEAETDELDVAVAGAAIESALPDDLEEAVAESVEPPAEEPAEEEVEAAVEEEVEPVEDEAPVEQGVGEEIPDEEPLEAEEAAAAEVESVEEEAIEEEPAEEEPTEEEVAEEERVEEEPAEEEPAEEGLVDAEPAKEESAGDVAALEEVAAAAREDEPAPAKRDGRKFLEERLREAVSAGKAMSAERESAPTIPADDTGRATDLLLQKALGTLSSAGRTAATIDPEFAEPAHATDEEVDQLVSTVIGGRAEKESVADEPEWDDEEAAPALELIGSEAGDKDDGNYHARMKLLWAIVLIALLALLAFIITRPSGDDELPDSPAPVGTSPATAEPQRAPGAEGSGEMVPAEDDGGDAAQVSEASGEREERLRRELGAERRQLQVEISQTQADRKQTNDEEDGGDA